MSDSRNRRGQSRSGGGSGKPRRKPPAKRAGSGSGGGKYKGRSDSTGKGRESRRSDDGKYKGRSESGQKGRSSRRRDDGRGHSESGYKGRGSGRKDDRGRSKSDEFARDRDVKPAKLPAGAEGLPRHVVESLMRVTPASRQNAALASLGAAAEAFSDGQYHAAVRKASHAKDLASRDATIREILGLASYRVGDWQTALRELRTYRRLSGETTHMPVEMDVLRALNRDDDIKALWLEFKKLGGGPAVKKEARVVYASYLIDIGDLDEAHQVAGKPKKVDDPWPEDLRLWYVAARIAALTGSKDEARRIASSILLEDPSFPGLDELDRLIDSS